MRVEACLKVCPADVAVSLYLVRRQARARGALQLPHGEVEHAVEERQLSGGERVDGKVDALAQSLQLCEVMYGVEEEEQRLRL